MSAIPSGEKVLFDGSPSAVLVAAHIVWWVLCAVGVWLLYALALPAVLPPVTARAGEVGMTAEQLAATMGWVEQGAFWLMVLFAAMFGWRAIVGGLRMVVTRYTITERRVQVATGLLNRDIENIEVERIADVAVRQPLMLRLFGQGNVMVVSSDRTAPRVLLMGLPQPQALMGELLRRAKPSSVIELR